MYKLVIEKIQAVNSIAYDPDWTLPEDILCRVILKDYNCDSGFYVKEIREINTRLFPNGAQLIVKQFEGYAPVWDDVHKGVNFGAARKLSSQAQKIFDSL